MPMPNIKSIKICLWFRSIIMSIFDLLWRRIY
nr:MAG TPA: hypothetical protein [Caudoviricetes sp.]